MNQTCRYAVLEHFKSEQCQYGVPLFLILGIDAPPETLKLNIFMLPSTNELLSHIPSSQKEWVLAMLADLSTSCETEYSDVKQTLRRLCNLGVGPIRTSQQGVVAFEDTGSAMSIIREEWSKFRGSKEKLYEFESFVPLNVTTLATLIAESAK